MAASKAALRVLEMDLQLAAMMVTMTAGAWVFSSGICTCRKETEWDELDVMMVDMWAVWLVGMTVVLMDV